MRAGDENERGGRKDGGREEGREGETNGREGEGDGGDGERKEVRGGEGRA